jgi:ubiquinone/menaquinone biosynthesis C-methylase UbiE
LTFLKTFDKEQLRILANEVKRILKPGGKFSFVEVSKPENKILSTPYGFYLGKIIPVPGRYLLGNSVEYKMLWHYTIKFGNAKITSEIFKEVGLRNLKHNSYFIGCSTGFSGLK